MPVTRREGLEKNKIVFKVLVPSLVVQTFLVAVACGGSGSEVRTPSGSPNPVVAEGTGAVGQSVQNLARVSSARAEFEWSIRREGFGVEGNGRYATQIPARLHLVAHYQGSGEIPSSFREENDSELLALGELVYINSPPLGDKWVLFTPQELATDWDVAQRLIAARSPLNYQAAVGGATAMENLGTDEIDGLSYQHYRASVDAGVLMDALADAYGSQGQVLLASRFSGPVAMEIWLDTVTVLPRRLVGNGQFTFMEGTTDLELKVDFLDLGGQPEIPEAPSDFVTIADLMGGR